MESDRKDRKTWVFIIGGTGETIPGDENTSIATPKAYVIDDTIQDVKKLAVLENELRLFIYEAKNDQGILPLNEEIKKKNKEIQDIKVMLKLDAEQGGFFGTPPFTEQEIKDYNLNITKLTDEVQALEAQVKEIKIDLNKDKRIMISKINALKVKIDKQKENTNEYIHAGKIHEMESLLKTSYNIYMPPPQALKTDLVKVKLVRAARSIEFNDKVTESLDQKKYGKAISQLDFKKLKLKDIKDYLYYASESKRIKECLKQLEDANKTGELPERIVLNGHSRGASATIELARAIYLKYGDQIKIVMNINDPVPGPGRHSKSKMIIPPNVESLIITYAGNETNELFKPQNLNEIRFDPSKTTVTTFTLPTTHDGIFTPQYSKVTQDINHAMWTSLLDNVNAASSALENTELPAAMKVKASSPVITPGPQREGEFTIGTDVNQNASLAHSPLAEFHKKLQGKIGISPSQIGDSKPSNHAVSPHSRSARKKELNKVEKTWKKHRIALSRNTLPLRNIESSMTAAETQNVLSPQVSVTKPTPANIVSNKSVEPTSFTDQINDELKSIKSRIEKGDFVNEQGIHIKEELNAFYEKDGFYAFINGNDAVRRTFDHLNALADAQPSMNRHITNAVKGESASTIAMNLYLVTSASFITVDFKNIQERMALSNQMSVYEVGLISRVKSDIFNSKNPQDAIAKWIDVMHELIKLGDIQSFQVIRGVMQDIQYKSGIAAKNQEDKKPYNEDNFKFYAVFANLTEAQRGKLAILDDDGVYNPNKITLPLFLEGKGINLTIPATTSINKAFDAYKDIGASDEAYLKTMNIYKELQNKAKDTRSSIIPNVAETTDYLRKVNQYIIICNGLLRNLQKNSQNDEVVKVQNHLNQLNEMKVQLVASKQEINSISKNNIVEAMNRMGNELRAIAKSIEPEERKMIIHDPNPANHNSRSEINRDKVNHTAPKSDIAIQDKSDEISNTPSLHKS